MSGSSSGMMTLDARMNRTAISVRHKPSKKSIDPRVVRVTRGIWIVGDDLDFAAKSSFTSRIHEAQNLGATEWVLLCRESALRGNYVR